MTTVLDQKHNLDLLLSKLQYHEIKSVTLSFRGSNDSGDLTIDEIEALDDDEEIPERLLDHTHVLGAKMSNAFDGATGKERDWIKKPPTLKELIDEVCLAELESQHGGWEIDVGSSGTISITPLAHFDNKKPFVVECWQNDDSDYDYEEEEYNDE